MFFSDTNLSFKILSVLELEWPERDGLVQPRHNHILSLRLQGSALFSDGHRNLEAHDGDLVYVSGDYPYSIKSEKEHLIVIHFKISGKNQPHFEVFTPQNAIVFEDDFRAIHRVWVNKKPGYYFKAMSIFYKIFEEMTKQFNPIYSTASYLKIKDAMYYLHQNFTDPLLSITKLCEISGFSDTQFRKVFYKVYGTTPLRYINTLRVDYAAELLKNSSFSVEEISQLSGFSDSKYFSTVYKKHRNHSPSSFRKTVK